MKKTIKYLVCIILILASLSLVSCSASADEQNLPEWSDKFDLFAKVLSYVEANYIGDLDYDELDYLTAYNLIRALDDFSYLTDDTVSTVSTASLGISITQTMYNEYVVDHVYQDFPCAEPQKDGFVMQRGDLIYAINGERVEGANSSVFNELNQGGVGTTLTLTVKRNGEILGDYSYTKIDKPIPKAYYIGDIDAENPQIGYIKLTEFSDSKTSSGEAVSVNEAFDNCVAKLKADNKTSVILDLRSNPGGSANILSHIASYFVPLDRSKGEARAVDFMSLKYAKSDEEYIVKVSEDNYLDIPVVVLVNEKTASAAEALTGAIRAYNPHHTIIGVKTYGKGVFQSRSPKISDKTSTSFVFDDTYYIMLVSGYYYIIDPSVEGGRYCIHKNGITPDIISSTSTKGDLSKDAEIIQAIKTLTE